MTRHSGDARRSCVTNSRAISRLRSSMSTSLAKSSRAKPGVLLQVVSLTRCGRIAFSISTFQSMPKRSVSQLAVPQSWAQIRNVREADLLFTHDLSGSDCTTTPAPSAKRAVEGDLLQGTLENREFLIVQSRDE